MVNHITEKFKNIGKKIGKATTGVLASTLLVGCAPSGMSDYFAENPIERPADNNGITFTEQEGLEQLNSIICYDLDFDQNESSDEKIDDTQKEQAIKNDISGYLINEIENNNKLSNAYNKHNPVISACLDMISLSYSGNHQPDDVQAINEKYNTTFSYNLLKNTDKCDYTNLVSEELENQTMLRTLDYYQKTTKKPVEQIENILVQNYQQMHLIMDQIYAYNVSDPNDTKVQDLTNQLKNAVNNIVDNLPESVWGDKNACFNLVIKNVRIQALNHLLIVTKEKGHNIDDIVIILTDTIKNNSTTETEKSL